MPRPDLILYNGRIYLEPHPRTRVDALAVWKGRVTDVGSTGKILKLKSRFTETIDLHGRAVLPGFSDSHIHLLHYGMLLQNLDLSRTRSIEEIQSNVHRKAASKPKDGWVLGRGWDDENLREHRYPDRYDLDRATANPVFAKRVCGHVAVANSRALSVAGIDASTPDPEGGMIVRDSQGKPNGVLKERAMELVESRVPESGEETRKALLVASRRLARLGLTSLHCIVSGENEFRSLHELKRKAKISQSIYAMVPLRLLDQLMSLGLATQKGTDQLRIGGLKLYLDGSLGARTAALNQPYSDEPASTGMLTMSNDELLRVANRAREGGFQLSIHSIGDKAVEMAIRTIGKVFGTAARRCRHRIEHSSIVSDQSISKMRRFGIIASVQPRFIYSDSWAQKRLGPDRIRQLYPFASMTRKGIVLAAGSDCPVEDPNPFEGIWSAITRPGLSSEERLTVGQAIAAYTTGASYASFSEDARGSLNPGKFADLVVLDRDPFITSPDELRRIQVLATMVEGVTVA